jgi:DNA-binding NarL/FixJ family response regulator
MMIPATQLAPNPHEEVTTALWELVKTLNSSTLEDEIANSEIVDINEREGLVVLAVNDMLYTIHVKRVDDGAELITLSPRQQEIVRLALQGLPNKTIAYQLKISQATVNTYMRRIYLKLNVNTRAEMAAKRS